MKQADRIMKDKGPAIRRVARYYRKRTRMEETFDEDPHQVKLPGELYRGSMLEPQLVKRGRLPKEPLLTFVSWTADADVACWFAHPDSFVSGFVKMMRPRARGYVSVLKKPDPEQVLFHHRWNPLYLRFLPSGRRHIPLAAIADSMGMDARQVHWNLGTQSEVIMENYLASVPVVPIEDTDCPAAKVLDARFRPPFL